MIEITDLNLYIYHTGNTGINDIHFLENNM